MDSKETRLMGIDYGEIRIGIALSDPFHVFAYSFRTIKNDHKFWAELKNIIKEKNVTRIILGLPSQNYTSSSALSAKIKKFKIDIEKKFKIEVILWDEEFTSEIAKQKIIESVNKKSKRRDKSLIDSNSAAIILQEFLDNK
jgi:putative holliday junction resolvase